MKLVIQGKNIEITDSIREYVHQKIEKAVSHYQHLTMEVDVHLSVARNPRINPNQTAEVTIYANGTVVRAEESSENLYASLDLVANKIARQLRKFKEKRYEQDRAPVKATAVIEEKPVAATLIDTDRTPELPAEVVRMKYFAMPPMTIQQALEQLDLVDHDFFMFRNIETGEINVIYERNHGGYGVIQPRNGNGHTNGKFAEIAHAHHPENVNSNGYANGHTNGKVSQP
ncbi:ribosome-associated translation inhibitor RaiA [Leptolyngbya sp. FACHB-711]|uniref:ribosome hibernation-promoting factor, HPF/YfiA family n=1 Tax=Leptolyngbya sp. FACHB-711 TaxID=2692813 RepID=UPI0016864B2D|nr:ribosome-associated translation inhibitor RaiA [Leptolyngbya sp. FACHB-711]MBD1853117.1 ribosome-associated translation inhibitor RaiA [Cyanobacteria bacterium FACHB-502]MBD2025968.1 ribosome-associated translation inhibitor RaiA [Leptolyngbya sp. FACHB-711]